MKKDRSKNKSYNSRSTRCIDWLLPFDFSTNNIPCAKMCLLNYISRQPIQKAKVIKNMTKTSRLQQLTAFVTPLQHHQIAKRNTLTRLIKSIPSVPLRLNEKNALDCFLSYDQ